MCLQSPAHHTGCNYPHHTTASKHSYDLPLSLSPIHPPSETPKMYSEGSVPSPEDVDYYEECVVADEVYLSSSPGSGELCTPLSDGTDAASRRDTDKIPKSNSGRITKKGKQHC